MFIVIEGLDGSGKGTQTELVCAGLRELGKKVLLLDYPRYGEKSAYFVERYLNGEYGEGVSAKQASLFYALDRFDDSYNFKDSLESYDYIISNRYVSASMIHQAGKIGDINERLEYIKWLDHLEFSILGIPRPDKVLFLDVPPNVSQRLIAKKSTRDYIKNGANKDIHEADVDHLTNAYATAHNILEIFSDWKKIDCCKDGDILPIEIITETILSNILQKNEF